MTTSSTPRFLIDGRDFEWTPSTREGFHSFCYLSSGDADGSRVAAIARRPQDYGWTLIWGPDDAGYGDGPWQRQDFAYVLDARDAVARRIQAYVTSHQHALLPALP